MDPEPSETDSGAPTPPSLLHPLCVTGVDDREAFSKKTGFTIDAWRLRLVFSFFSYISLRLLLHVSYLTGTSFKKLFDFM